MFPSADRSLIFLFPFGLLEPPVFPFLPRPLLPSASLLLCVFPPTTEPPRPHPNATSSTIMIVKPSMVATVTVSSYPWRWASGTTSSTTT